VAPSEAAGRYVVRASGPVGRQILSVLDGQNGERVQLRSETGLAVGAVTGLAWEAEVLLPPEEPSSQPEAGPPG